VSRPECGHNTRVSLARISWLVTVGLCLIAALLLLIDGYVGYFGVLLAVGAAAAVNLR
jgi:membrane-bound ClpP family serine protease